MPRGELTLFSYTILGLVGRNGAGPHDLRRMARQGRVLDWAGESQYYVEPKRLAKLGYLDARKEPGKTRERTIYTLTEKGIDALREWGRDAARSSRRSRARRSTRMLVADLVGEAADGAQPRRATRRDRRRARGHRRRRGDGGDAPAPARGAAARVPPRAAPARAAARLGRRGRRGAGRLARGGPARQRTAAGSRRRAREAGALAGTGFACACSTYWRAFPRTMAWTCMAA